MSLDIDPTMRNFIETSVKEMEIRLLKERDKKSMVEEVENELMRECNSLDAAFAEMDKILTDATANSQGLHDEMDELIDDTRSNMDDISKWIITLNKMEVTVNTRMMGLMRDLKEFHKGTIQQWTEEKKALLVAWFNKMKADREDVIRGHERLLKNAPGMITRAAAGATNMDKSERLRQVALREELIDAKFHKMKDTFEENVEKATQRAKQLQNAAPPGFELSNHLAKEGFSAPFKDAIMEENKENKTQHMMDDAGACSSMFSSISHSNFGRRQHTESASSSGVRQCEELFLKQDASILTDQSNAKREIGLELGLSLTNVDQSPDDFLAQSMKLLTGMSDSLTPISQV